MRIDWDSIDTVLLDMDGTIIDKHYEDYFWGSMVPQMYARKHSTTLKESKDSLSLMYKEQEGTKNFGDIDFWEKKLGMDLWKVRFSMDYMVKLHPHTMRFLKFLRKSRKNVYIVSACPLKEIEFKVNVTGIGKFFDGYFSENEIGKSKYETDFWKRLEKRLKFRKDRTVLADDNEKVLKAARLHGIKYLLFKSKNSSKMPPKKAAREFIHVRHFDDILKD